MSGKLHALGALVAYCLRRFPLFYACLAMSVATVLLELAAMASLIPLAAFGAGREIAADSGWASLLALFGAKPEIKSLVILFLVLLIARIGTHLAASILASLFFRRLIAHLSSTAFSVFVTKLTFPEIQKKSIGYYLNLAGEEANRASQIVNGVVRLAPAAFLAILYFGLIASQSATVAAWVVVFLATSLFLLRDSFRRSHQLGGQQQAESRALNSHFIESLSALRSVKAFTAEYFVAHRYKSMIDGYARTCFKIDAINAVSRFAPILILIALAGGWTLAGVDDASLRTQLPGIAVMVVLLMRFFPVTGQALDIFLRIVADLRSGEEVIEVLKRVEDLRAADAGTGGADCPAISTIEFREVSFSYSSSARPMSCISLHLEKGRSYALVGPSGAGKSTLFDLLLKYIRPQEGSILVNGVDISLFSDLSLRRHVALVEQQVRIFNDTLLHNVTLGLSVPESKVLEACSQAGLGPLLSSLPQGLNSLLDYQGSNLSGGQRQRIGLARALVRDPGVLLLDESTNALDRETRDEIVNRILSLYRDRIVVFATHDEAVIERTDVVVNLPAAQAMAAVQAAVGECS